MKGDEQKHERLSPEWWAAKAERRVALLQESLRNVDPKVTPRLGGVHPGGTAKAIEEQSDLASKLRELARMREYMLHWDGSRCFSCDAVTWPDEHDIRCTDDEGGHVNCCTPCAEAVLRRSNQMDKKSIEGGAS